MNYRRSKCLPAGVLAALPAIQPHYLGRKMSPRLRRNDVKTPPCSRDHAAVAAAAGGDQPRSEAVWDRSTRGGGASSITRPGTPRGKRLADSYGLLQRLQHRQTDGGARGDGHLRAGTHAVRRQMLRRETCNRVLPDGLGRKVQDRLLQRGATRGHHGTGVVLHAAPAFAEADPTRVRTTRGGSIRLPGRHKH